VRPEPWQPRGEAMSKKLLLITADPVLATAYRARFIREGFEVEHHVSGHEALARARRWIPDLILLDVTLPGMSGLEVLKWLRDVPWLVQVPTLLLIEHTLAPDVLQECLFWGAAGYLEKDHTSLHELVACARAVLHQAAARAARLHKPATASSSS